MRQRNWTYKLINKRTHFVTTEKEFGHSLFQPSNAVSLLPFVSQAKTATASSSFNGTSSSSSSSEEFFFFVFFNSYVRSCLLLSFVITGSRKGDSLIIQISDKTWQNESFCFREYFLFSLISFLGRWLGLNHVEPRGEWWRWVSNECFYFFCGIWCFFLFLFVLIKVFFFGSGWFWL